MIRELELKRNAMKEKIRNLEIQWLLRQQAKEKIKNANTLDEQALLLEAEMKSIDPSNFVTQDTSDSTQNNMYRSPKKMTKQTNDQHSQQSSASQVPNHACDHCGSPIATQKRNKSPTLAVFLDPN